MTPKALARRIITTPICDIGLYPLHKIDSPPAIDILTRMRRRFSATIGPALNRLSFWRLLPVLGLLIIACAETASDAQDSGPTPPPEARAEELPYISKLYVNGVIWTGAGGDAEDASVIGLRGDRIAFIGPALPGAFQVGETIDLEGQFVMPGMIDNHTHFLEGGAGLASVDLRDADSRAVFKKRILAFVATQPAGRWVLNGNWDHELWGGEEPHRSWIDAGTGDNPVFLSRLDGHMGLANAVALEAAGITAETPDPEGGVIGRDEDGTPNGILRDNAMTLIYDVVPAPSDDELVEHFLAAQTHALGLGLTKIHHVSGNPTETSALRAFKMLQNRGLMKIRAHISSPIESWPDMQAAITGGDRGDMQLSWGGVKGLIDGSLGSRTAWLYDPYKDDSSTAGLTLMMPEQFGELMERADAAGLQLSIHAIGDRAIDTVLDKMVEIGGDDPAAKRFRIEHFQHPTEEAIQKAAIHGIIASAQPYHAVDDGRWAHKRIGEERLATTYAFRDILDADGILAFGSDWPVAPLSPLKGIYAAVTRRTADGLNPDGWIAEQKISVEEAMIAYTRDAAYALGAEAEIGTLEPGKFADFVILSADPRAVPEVEIHDISVVETIISGRRVFKAR